MTEENSTSIKELLLRIESSLKSEINSLKREVEIFQQRSVTRQEYDTAMVHLRSDIERLEREIEKGAVGHHDEFRQLKQDLKDGQARMIALGGVLITAANFILSWFIG